MITPENAEPRTRKQAWIRSDPTGENDRRRLSLVSDSGYPDVPMKKVLLVLGVLVCLGLVGCGDDGGDDGSAGMDAGANACTNVNATVVNFSEACTEDTQCECNLCFTYGNGDRRCTKACTVDADCEAPSPGCSGMGVCKREGG